jgi:hypothetical protein
MIVFVCCDDSIMTSEMNKINRLFLVAGILFELIEHLVDLLLVPVHEDLAMLRGRATTGAVPPAGAHPHVMLGIQEIGLHYLTSIT